MSRAINVSASEAEVTALCRKRAVTISAIEPLVSGGTRVVLMNGDAAELMRKEFGRKVMLGVVKRAPLRPARREFAL